MGARHAVAPEATVRLLDDPVRSPVTTEERRLVARLSKDGPQPYQRLVAALARDMYRDEVRRGGWATEVGVVGTAPFQPDAERAIRDAAGALWTIDRASGES